MSIGTGAFGQDRELSPSGRRLTAFAALAGWFGAGTQLALVPLTARPAAIDLFSRAASSPPGETLLGQWFAWQTCSFLFGAAFGGVLFGWVADRVGRTRSLGLAILVYSGLSIVCGLARTPGELLALRFLLSLGIGGAWPCGVALLAEAWPDRTRPTLAGLMGTAANVGILLVGMIGRELDITAETWRDAMFLAGLPLFLAAFVLAAVPESPDWLAARQSSASQKKSSPLAELFWPPLLGRTVLGILLGTIPLLGAWGAGKWLVPWADAASEDPGLKANTQAIWAFGAVLGSAAGGWLASRLGRRASYFLVSAGSLVLNVSIFRFFTPTEPGFLPMAFSLGLVSTIFFGWLPLYLPELFPTRVRATGTGIAFNFGRFGSAAGVLGAGAMAAYFGGDYAKVGATTAWIYALGMIIILFAPDVSTLED